MGSLVWHPSAQATTNAQSSVAPTTGAPSDWSQLSASQRKALAPLASQWASLAPSSRVKWVEVARRFNQLAPAEQARLQERMASWAALPSDQRGEARLRYQQSRQLPAGQRQEKWQAYQALSNEEKQDLGRQAQRRSKPVMLPDRVAGPREPAQAYGNKRATSASGSPAKSNTVPNAVTASPRQPTVVSPATVKAGSGATTNLVTRRPSPPMHQQVGMPKVNAAKGSVDPVTLLPRTGAQGAAMASLPASGQRP
ncbi:MAG: hypothetical protein A2711_03205 [Burkholderiales bacterium RIFCSPHIGHO2_01_FULL_63_240]|nr:MAG: hypothetical protein A2711_03205 [Burkholderiales bacterium RIFCSPHIGHO2_01_FULL_63_240]